VLSPGLSRRRGGVSAGPARRWLRVAAAAAVLATALGAAAGTASQGAGIAAVAVFPVENLSGGGIPADQVRKALIDRLTAAGVRVLDDGALEGFIARHRIRYTAGIDVSAAASLRKETGVDGVLIASVDLSLASVPPKFGMAARLVSVASTPVVAWADDVALAGDEAPGLFGLGLVNDHPALVARALDRLGTSLSAYLKTGRGAAGPKAADKFRPKVSFGGEPLRPGVTRSVAVVPFFNLSGRRDAGEILALLFMRHLSTVDGVRVIDLGVTRRHLLDARVIMDAGLSVVDAERVAERSDADFVLGGRVFRYEDYEGVAGRTVVEFSTMLIERKSRRIVWSSESYNDGNDGVLFLERGAAKSAHAMATQMVGLTAATLAGRGR